MKAILCSHCNDFFGLLQREWRRCHCRASAGVYLRDNHGVRVSGPCRVIAMRNQDLLGEKEGRWADVPAYDSRYMDQAIVRIDRVEGAIYRCWWPSMWQRFASILAPWGLLAPFVAGYLLARWLP